MRTRGVVYGTHGASVEEDLRTIRDELHASTVSVRDDDVRRMATTARKALELGLDVWLQPHREEVRADVAIATAVSAARVAEELRRDYPDRVTLLLGCEFSLFTRGLLPGPHVFVRLLAVRRTRLFRRRMNRKLSLLLRAAMDGVRREYFGPVSYAAAMWEDVDWTPFDFVGVNLYRMGDDVAGYERHVADLVANADRPVVITEFGCGSYVGADLLGPRAFTAVNWFADPPRVRAGTLRDEAVQARYLGELIDVYERTGVDGCFVYSYAMRDFPHRPDDAEHDLDMAGFALVATLDDGSQRRKRAFGAVADRFAAGKLSR